MIYHPKHNDHYSLYLKHKMGCKEIHSPMVTCAFNSEVYRSLYLLKRLGLTIKKLNRIEKEIGVPAISGQIFNYSKLQDFCLEISKPRFDFGIGLTDNLSCYYGEGKFAQEEYLFRTIKSINNFLSREVKTKTKKEN